MPIKLHGGRSMWNESRLLVQLCRKIPQLALGILLVCLGFSDSALAINGYIQVNNCVNCVASSDYAASAIQQAKGSATSGTYIQVSTTGASTAFVEVTGTLGWVTIDGAREPTLVNVTTNFVDTSGNSLAGFSEGTLETYFSNMDQTYFGTARNGEIGFINVPPDYNTSFINSDVEDIGAQIPGWIASQYHITIIPVPCVVTVSFQDGTTAQYIKKDNSSAGFV